jgi:L-asparagine transporter-like permease
MLSKNIKQNKDKSNKQEKQTKSKNIIFSVGMDLHLISYYIGIAIVFLTHIFMMVTTKDHQMMIHSAVNIFAALCIAYYFMNKEKMISI